MPALIFKVSFPTFVEYVTHHKYKNNYPIRKKKIDAKLFSHIIKLTLRENVCIF